MTSVISLDQSNLFKEWIISSEKCKSTEQANVSKRILKAEYEKRKANILHKLESKSVDLSPDVTTEKYPNDLESKPKLQDTFVDIKWID
ncbi:MAG: hypothetical protein NVS2B14_12810 [Chamaesiphon sp.]